MQEKNKPTGGTAGKTSKGEQMQDKDTFHPPFDADILADEATDGTGVTLEKTAAHLAALATGEGATEAVNGAVVWTGEDLILRKIEHIPCLVEPFLQQTGLACLAGSSDTGKSTILRQLAISVAAGKPRFLGWQLNTRHQSAIVVSTEDDPTAVSFLLNRQAQGIAPERLKSLRFIFDFENLFETLDAQLKAAPADLVVIDCFADAFGNDLKDTQKIRLYLNKCQALAEAHQCLFLFLHHTGKRTESSEPSKNNLLSGQGFEAKMRLVIELRADPARADQRHFCIVKGNYLAAEHKRESYVLDFDTDAFTFNATTERTPFEMLSQKADDGGRSKREKATALKDQGKTLAEIAKIMGYSNASGVSKLLKRFNDEGADE
jgi:RecA-family ATPase